MDATCVVGVGGVSSLKAGTAFSCELFLIRSVRVPRFIRLQRERQSCMQEMLPFVYKLAQEKGRQRDRGTERQREGDVETEISILSEIL